jgi:predicted acetyltransferase
MSAALRCRFARQDEIEEAARLVAHSFPGATRPPAWWQEQLRSPPWGGGPETLLVGELEGRLVAALQLHPLQQWISGEAVAVAGVGTVSISPVQRRRGLGAVLMAAALRAARERGDLGSALYPFRTSFYGRLGYGHAGEALQYRVAPSELPDSPGRRDVRILDDDAGLRDAHDLYGRWARTQTGQLERSAPLFVRACTAQDRVLVGYRGDGGILDGYALAVYRPDLPRQERYLEVDELVWMTDAARRALYGWLSSVGDQWEQLLLRSLPSHQLGDWLREPRLPPGEAPLWGLWQPAATLLMGPMFRIVDMAGAWDRRRVADGPPLAFSVEVEDVQLPENGGHWSIELAGGRSRAVRTGGAAAAEASGRSRAVHAGGAAAAGARAGTAAAGAPPGSLSAGATRATLRLDISTLSRIFIGSLAPSAGLAAGLLECDRPELLPALDAALALPEPWTFDRF